MFVSVCTEEAWSAMIKLLGYDTLQLRDARYDQIIHMVTAANGAEPFYQVSNNPIRSEGLELAKERDYKASQVGRGGGWKVCMGSRNVFPFGCWVSS